jgi:hypothetical protein
LKPASTPIAPASVPLKAGAAKAPVAAQGDASADAGDDGSAAPKSAPLSAGASPASPKPSKVPVAADSDSEDADSEPVSVSGLDKILAFAALAVAALALLSTFLTYSVLKA